jgi:hypothetical protein
MKKLSILIVLFALSISAVFSQQTTTTLPQVFGNPGNDLAIPVIVNNFNGVASISMVLEFSSSVLEFNGLQNIHSNLTGNFMTNVMPGTTGNNLLVISWFALVPANIGNGNMMELKFHYLGGSSSLKWDTLTFGNCQYTNMAGDPLPAVFMNGTVSQVSPNTTYAPVINAIPASDVFVPIRAVDFNNVSQLHLSMTHDHQVINYQSVEYVNPAFSASSFSVSNGGNIVHIDWQSSQPVTVGNDTLFVLRFHYVGGTSLMEWDTINTLACYYKDLNGNVLPGTFISGAVNPATVQLGIASASICNGGDAMLPVSVGGADNVKSFSLKLAFNAAVVNYTSFQNLNPMLNNGNFNVTSNSGILLINWFSDTPVNLGTNPICEFNFQSIVSNGGLSDFSWSTSDCQFLNADGLSFPLNLVSGSLMSTPFINLGQDMEVCNYNSSTLYAGALFSSYQWSTGDTGTSIMVDSTMGSGFYAVTVTDVMGCTGHDEVFLSFSPCIGINEQDGQSEKLNVYPNPAQGGHFTISMDNITEDAEISVFDLTGRLLESRISTSSGNSLNQDFNLDLTRGLYFIQVSTTTQIYTQRLIID